MKSVLMSIQPQWVAKIANGEKTVEVRKSRPKLETPFKVYIYETKAEYKNSGFRFNGIGKVIGEFVCDEIIYQPYHLNGYGLVNEIHIMNCSCLSEKELYHYLQGKRPYLWHISDLKIYDKPKNLREFYHYCGDNPKCDGCQFHYYESNECGTDEGCSSPCYCCKPLTRPPQSWCYVEELGGD